MTDFSRQTEAEQDFARMQIYLQNVESTWCYALYDDVPTRDSLIERLRQSLAPIPVLERSLAGLGTDNALEVLRQIPSTSPAPVVCFTGLYNAIFQGVLAPSLDLQRELFADLPHRLVFWLRDAEWRELYRKAPNFSSRTNGTFDFQLEAAPESDYQPLDLRPDPKQLEQQKKVRQRIEFLKKRLQFLDEQKETNQLETARTLMEIGEEVKKLDGYHWTELEGIFTRAERHFTALRDKANQAKALFEAGQSAYYGGVATSKNHLEEALELYRTIGDRLGEANTLKAIADVQQFRDESSAALENYEKALELYRAVGARLGEANTLSGLAQLQVVKNKELASSLLEDALVIYRQIEDRYSEAAHIGNFGMAYLRNGEKDKAKLYLLESAKLFDEMNLPEQAKNARQLANS